jgi:hypothetical protein
MFSAEGVYQLLAFKFRLFEPHGRKCLEFGPNCPPAIEHGLLQNPPALVDDFPSYIYICVIIHVRLVFWILQLAMFDDNGGMFTGISKWIMCQR